MPTFIPFLNEKTPDRVLQSCAILREPRPRPSQATPKLRSRRFSLVLLAVVALTAATGGAVRTRDARAASAAPTIGVIQTPNFTHARRSTGISQVVVHVTEGGFWGSVSWLRNRRSGGSSHFVVSRNGEIVQLVNLADVAWHAGNNRTNWHSIGIEHEGYTRRGRFTQAQYKASARLLAYLSYRLGIPLDRRHVIGHNQVPDPDGTGRGGFDHHTDPGRHWRWRHYLALAREYAKSPVVPQLVRMSPPGAPDKRVVHERRIACGSGRSIHFTTLEDREVVTSLAAWRAKTCGRRMWRVDFFVDGHRVGRDTVWPFMYEGSRGLNTTVLVNGWHTLTLRAHGPRRYTLSKSIRVRVANPPFAVAPAGLADGQAVARTVTFRAATNAPAARIDLLSGGQVVAHAGAGHRVDWDSSAMPNGVHDLELRATALDGRTATHAFSVLVANAEAFAEPAPHVLWQSMSDWQTVRGAVAWQALIEGTVQQVEFWVDGRLRSIAVQQPYSFGEGGLWDTSSLRPGPHDLAVRVVGTGGRIAESRALVFVSR
jgi:N-acetyl-anhydromuramyl-L-alanine amidase AmpD